MFKMQLQRTFIKLVIAAFYAIPDACAWVYTLDRLGQLQKNCINPYSGLSHASSLNGRTPAPCLLPLLNETSDGKEPGGEFEERSEQYLFSAGTYNISWSFVKSKPAEDRAG